MPLFSFFNFLNAVPTRFCTCPTHSFFSTWTLSYTFWTSAYALLSPSPKYSVYWSFRVSSLLADTLDSFCLHGWCRAFLVYLAMFNMFLLHYDFLIIIILSFNSPTTMADWSKLRHLNICHLSIDRVVMQPFRKECLRLCHVPSHNTAHFKISFTWSHCNLLAALLIEATATAFDKAMLHAWYALGLGGGGMFIKA